MTAPNQPESKSSDTLITVKWMATAVFVILWLFALVVAYFWAHKPFDDALLAGLGRSLASIVAWVGLLWLGAALGGRLAAGILIQETAAVRLALAAGLGLGVLSLLTLALGLIGWLRPPAAWALVLISGIGLRRDLRFVWRDWRAVSWPWPQNNFERWLALYGGITLLLTFVMALTPESAWDALVYHLTGPSLFIEAGRVTQPIDLPYLGFPQLGEMQFTLGMLLVGDRVASLLHFGYGLMGMVIAVGLGRRIFGRGVAWLTAVSLLSVPSLLGLMQTAYVDITLLFYMTAAFYIFTRWWEHKGHWQARQWLILLGVYAGFCGGVKYTAVAVPVAVALALAWASRRDGFKVLLQRLALLTAVVVVVTLPWLVENWLTTGNPFYPFLFENALYWDKWRAWWYDRPGTGLLASAPWRLLIAPLEATILGAAGSAAYDATIGPFILGAFFLLPFVWGSLTRQEKKIGGYLLLFLGVNYALWLTGLARSALLLQTRLLLPTFGVMAVVSGLALDRLKHLRRPQLAVDWLAQAVISLTLGLLLFATISEFIQVNPLPVVVGLEARDSYLTRRLGVYQSVMGAVNELPADAQVVFLWEPRSYGCQVRCHPDALLDRFLHLIHFYGYDAAAIAAEWQARGFTHVLLHQAGLEFIITAGFDPVTPHDVAVWQDLQAMYLVPVREWDSAYVLYELRHEVE